MSFFSQNVKNAVGISSLLSLRCQERFGFKEMKEKERFTTYQREKSHNWLGLKVQEVYLFLVHGFISLQILRERHFLCSRIKAVTRKLGP